MKTALTAIQIVLSALLTFLIFMQSTGENENRQNLAAAISLEKRGWERAVFIFTLIIMVAFIISSIVQIVV